MKADPLHCHGVEALPEALRTLRHTLTAWALEAGIEPDRAQDISLASYEALANVADHAYNGTGAGVVDLDAVRHPDRVEVVITDHGRWRAPVHDPSPVSLRGRGLLLLRASADEADITAGDDGTVVTLRWDLAGDLPVTR
ncbi:ATP-binding protein [Amycolatopsis sp. H20-H5]|uniref:ATP-binding protein n=1 Tax=Amycolatopsis sp. H20-H5 TaxID=3046309 RepID=UPI002DBEC396|nr:ATP-binding protein [Amycolatopsis sp. H20-H5]MEC3982513.1 ATP-binding protein [Amycolatopsis sp. H20-H5]